MANFKIITDTTADLPAEYIKENDLGIMALSYTICGETYGVDKDLTGKEFFDLMRAGNQTSTSQPSPEQIKGIMEQYLDDYEGIIVIALSSGISGTVNSANIARADVLEEHPDANIVVIDSLCASLGEGLLVHKAVQLKKNGATMEETVEWLEKYKMNIVHSFTVEDLMFLYHGGRLKKSTAVVGTLINIKPVLHVNDEGKLVNIKTVRGRKKSLQALVDYMGEHMGSFKDQNDIVFISHGDTIEDAQFVADKIKETYGIDSFLINYMGSTIGSHAGPGTVALFFMGETR